MNMRVKSGKATVWTFFFHFPFPSGFRVSLVQVSPGKSCICSKTSEVLFTANPERSSGPYVKLLSKLLQKYDDFACICDDAKVILVNTCQFGPSYHERNDSRSAYGCIYWLKRRPVTSLTPSNTPIYSNTNKPCIHIDQQLHSAFLPPSHWQREA